MTFKIENPMKQEWLEIEHRVGWWRGFFAGAISFTLLSIIGVILAAIVYYHLHH